jgi:hypothetical protein
MKERFVKKGRIEKRWVESGIDAEGRDRKHKGRGEGK